jgi:HK97 family phage portal protein
MRAKAQWVAGVPIEVQQKRTVDGELQWAAVATHPLLDLISKPNKSETWGYLIQRFVYALDSTGNAYLIYDPGDKELFFVHSSIIKANADARGLITGYTVSRHGVVGNLESDVIIHARYPDPNGEFYGAPPAEALKQTILTKLYFNKHLKNYFANNCLTGTTLSTEQLLGDEDRLRLRKEFNAMHKGPDKAFNLGILDRGTKLDNLSHNLKDLVPAELQGLVKQETLATFGVPPIMVGDLDQATYASASIEKRVFVENTGLPLLTTIEDTLNLHLVPKFGDPASLRIRYPRDKIPALQEDQNDLSKRVLNEYNSGTRTLNEARDPLGLDPDPEGDQYKPRPTSIAFGMNDDTGGNGKSVIPLASTGWPTVGCKADAPPPDIPRWKAHYDLVISIEKRYERRMRHFADSQADRVLAALDSITGAGKFMSSLYWHTKDTLPDDDAERLFDLEAENLALRQELGPLGRTTIHRAGADAVSEVTSSLSFNIKDPFVFEMIENFENRLAKVNDTTYNAIKEVIRVGYEEESTLDQIRKQIQEEFTEFNKVRATRIAQTETNGLVNGGAWAGHKQAGITKKEWLSAFLSTSRQWHMDANGQVRMMDEPFEVGGSLLTWPGSPGPYALAADTINCHCSYTPLAD